MQHVGEFGEVGLQPVLLGIAFRRETQIADHRVDVVLQLRHLAARLDLDRARQIPLGHGGRDLGDGAHLRGEVRGEQVDVAGEVLPGAGGARNIRLPAETALDADFPRDRGDLIRESRERVRHVVDGLGERRHLALRTNREVLLEVSIGDRGHHLHDAAHLLGEVHRHHVHGIGQVLQVPATPGTWAWPPSLPSVPTSRATRVTSEAKPLS